MRAFSWQLRRALIYLWSKTVLTGFQTFAVTSALGISLLLILWISGLFGPSNWLIAVIFGTAFCCMAFQLIRRAPNTNDAADLVDKWSGHSDLARSYVNLPPKHVAMDLLAHQTEAAANSLPSKLLWPELPLHSLVLPILVTAIGVVVMPNTRDASARITATRAEEHQTNTAESALMQPKPVHNTLAETNRVHNNTSAADETETSILTLADILVETVETAALESEMEADTKANSETKLQPFNSDGAGEAAAADRIEPTKISHADTGDQSLHLRTSASDRGRSLAKEATGAPGSEASDLRTFVTLPSSRASSGKAVAMSHDERALSRRYFTELSGVK